MHFVRFHHLLSSLAVLWMWLSQVRPWRCAHTTACVLAALACCETNVVAGDIRFEDVTRAAGLYEPLEGMMGHGGAWGDVDGDGWIDLFVGGFSDRPDEAYTPANGPVPSQLLRNMGNGRFEPFDIPAAVFHGRISGAVFADLDNDGRLDLYSANNSRGRSRHTDSPQRESQIRLSNLFHNTADGLVDVSQSSGACPGELLSARNIGVFDADGDGLLDLLVIEDTFVRDSSTRLFRNLGGMKFEDMTERAGLPDDLFGLGLAVADINEDGRPDFFVGHSNRLFLSTEGGRWVESETLTKLFAWKPVKPRDREDWPCGACFGDLNRDGRLDLVIGIHHERARNRVYLNMGVKEGVPRFRDVSAAAGLPAELNTKSPHVEIQDFDNDGWPDLYFSSAWLDEDGRVTPLVYRNLGVRDGVPRFESIRPYRSDQQMVYYPAGPSGDYDRDGRTDLLLINWFRGNHTRLLRNTSPSGQWLDVTICGREMNRMGLGAQVRLYAAGSQEDRQLLGFQELTTGYGYASGQPAVCHFGLGETSRVDVEVTLPRGRGKIVRKGVASGQRLVIDERELAAGQQAAPAN